MHHVSPTTADLRVVAVWIYISILTNARVVVDSVGVGGENNDWYVVIELLELFPHLKVRFVRLL